MIDIDWSKQHPGVHQANFKNTLEVMPDIAPIFETFPDNPNDFTWDIKVHMLFPRQMPCMPGWHTDFVPRTKSGVQQFDKVQLDRPMYMWLSGPPLTQFKHGFVKSQQWHRFNQADEHRGLPSDSFTWRAFVRGIHKDILQPKAGDYKRRHSQVYVLDDNYQW